MMRTRVCHFHCCLEKYLSCMHVSVSCLCFPCLTLFVQNKNQTALRVMTRSESSALKGQIRTLDSNLQSARATISSFEQTNAAKDEEIKKLKAEMDDKVQTLNKVGKGINIPVWYRTRLLLKTSCGRGMHNWLGRVEITEWFNCLRFVVKLYSCTDPTSAKFCGDSVWSKVLRKWKSFVQILSIHGFFRCRFAAWAAGSRSSMKSFWQRRRRYVDRCSLHRPLRFSSHILRK